MAKENNSPRDKIVDSLIEKIEQNPEVWQKTWRNLGAQRPHNPISGTVYRGVNMINLAIMSSFMGNDPRWATFNQARDAGMPVKRGSKSVASAIFHKVMTELKTSDGTIHKINANSNDEKLEKVKEIIRQSDPQFYSKIKDIKYLSVLSNIINQTNEFHLSTKVLVTATPLFNYSQLENAPALEINNQSKTWEDLQRAENLLKATGYNIIHDRLNENYYSPSTKEIHLVSKLAFKSPEAYYSAAFHECAHAKMDDKTIPLKFNPDDYIIDINARAKEELRAEMSSIFICAELGINYDVQNHASYLNSWLNILKEDKSELWNAASDSNKIADAIIDLEQQINLEQNITNNFQDGDLFNHKVKIAGAEYLILSEDYINGKIVSELIEQGYNAEIVLPTIYDNEGVPISEPTAEDKTKYLTLIKEKIILDGFETLSKNDVQIFFNSTFPSAVTKYSCNDSELMHTLRINPHIEKIPENINLASINHRNIFSETALELAIRAGNNDIAKALIDNGADINMLYVREASGEDSTVGYYTVSHMAALDKNEELLSYLESAGADPNIADSDGETAREVLEATIYQDFEQHDNVIEH